MPAFAAIALENLLEPRVTASLKDPRTEYSSPPSPFTNFNRSGGLPELRRRGNESESCGVAESLVNDGVEGVGAEEDEEFLDPRSELDSVDLNLIQFDSRSFVSAQGDFFDAVDEFSSDGSISNTPSSEYRLSEFHASRRNLLEEIEKRKTAEEVLVSMQSHWARIGIVMSEAGLTFPEPPAVNDSVLDQMSQEVVVAKFVAEAVGRGVARAEAEEAAIAVIESKDQEIMRLHDKLQYYETVNHEMSQRKLVEVARKQQKRKSRRRWLWRILGVVIPVGASLAAYSYISHTSESESMPLLDSPDIIPPETSVEVNLST